MNEKEPELLPCPFCGGKPVINLYPTGDKSVYCPFCKVETFIGEKMKVTEAWNRRTAVFCVAESRAEVGRSI